MPPLAVRRRVAGASVPRRSRGTVGHRHPRATRRGGPYDASHERSPRRSGLAVGRRLAAKAVVKAAIRSGIREYRDHVSGGASLLPTASGERI